MPVVKPFEEESVYVKVWTHHPHPSPIVVSLCSIILLLRPRESVVVVVVVVFVVVTTFDTGRIGYQQALRCGGARREGHRAASTGGPDCRRRVYAVPRDGRREESVWRRRRRTDGWTPSISSFAHAVTYGDGTVAAAAVSAGVPPDKPLSPRVIVSTARRKRPRVARENKHDATLLIIIYIIIIIIYKIKTPSSIMLFPSVFVVRQYSIPR